MDAAGALRASPLFQTFTDTGISILATICQPKQFPPGAILFAENMVSDSMFIIGDGRVALASKNAGGQDLALGELTNGDWLGELSLISTGQRMCTATAVVMVTAFEIRQADFQRLTASKPQACMKLLMTICTNVGAKVGANKEALKAILARV
ncbi:MAG: cyclic nucleotide-binding domain-containing protein [Archangium sp.]|nr:cyclic nucleotide-binding domain-containing protein [Archangium sp.]